jgi:cytochrome P450 / NADPH-cytochrome P450 reductase
MLTAAGHETTSGLLSFAMANLLKNPHTYLKAQQEIDAVLGSRAIEVTDIKNLKYLNAVLRETARLTPTVPFLQKHVNPSDTTGFVTVQGGRYRIKHDDQILILVGKCQRDPKVWGETACEFIPERMYDENFDKVMAAYPGAWKVSGSRYLLRSMLTRQAFRKWKKGLHWSSLCLAGINAGDGHDSSKLRCQT